MKATCHGDAHESSTPSSLTLPGTEEQGNEGPPPPVCVVAPPLSALGETPRSSPDVVVAAAPTVVQSPSDGAEYSGWGAAEVLPLTLSSVLVLSIIVSLNSLVVHLTLGHRGWRLVRCLYLVP